MTDTYTPSLAALTGGGNVPAWSIADRLRKAREHAGLEQEQLARFTALSRATISAAENGRTRLRGSSLRLWAVGTGVSLAWIETGEAPTGDAVGASEGLARPEGLEPPTFCSGAVRGPHIASAGLFVLGVVVLAALGEAVER